jgi:hypothetical protein
MKKISSENGQTLVLVVIGFIAFVAILALVLDGGNAYAAKRKAQNAADAGALAGAMYMCKHRTEVGAEDAAAQIARDYAGLNGADNFAVVDANLSRASVIVTANVTKNTFFAGLIGFNQVSPRAEAEAACRPPSGVGVLPVAWACRNTVEGGVNLPGFDCAQVFGPCDDLSCIYILMDSVKVSQGKKNSNCDPDQTDPTKNNYCYCDPTITDPNSPLYCPPQDLVCSVHGPSVPIADGGPLGCDYVAPNTTDCDLDDDCVDELMTGGARSWLDLDGGGGGASELSDWILNGFPESIPPHKWIPEESGVATSIFKDATNRVGWDVTLPVFNKMCTTYPDVWDPNWPNESTAQCTYGSHDDRSIAANTKNFHIISFAKFHITCIQTGKNKAQDESGHVNGCPGHDEAVNNDSIDDNDKTIEGYFKDEPVYGFGGEGEWYDAGTFTVVLVR